MARLYADISLLPIEDVLQWIETTKKTGTLSVSYNGVTKRFYFEEGSIVFISSDKPGERLGEALVRYQKVSPEALRDAMGKSLTLGLPLTGCLLTEGIIDRDGLVTTLNLLAQEALRDCLSWKDGRLEFEDVLPERVREGPIRLHTTRVLFVSAKDYDELNRQRGYDAGEEHIKDVIKGISDGNIHLPPLPDVLVRINRAIKEDRDITEVAKIIMADQILTTKILKIVNSSMYARRVKVTTLHQALVILGMKTTLSIVTMYTIENLTVAKVFRDRLKDILRHCLVTGFISKTMAPFFSEDPEEAFVCGLLHDIGKTVILENLPPATTEQTLEEVLKEYHPLVGRLLAERWRLPEGIQKTIAFHHKPDRGDSIVRLIHMADRLAHQVSEPEDLKEALQEVGIPPEDKEEIFNKIMRFKNEAERL